MSSPPDQPGPPPRHEASKPPANVAPSEALTDLAFGRSARAGSDSATIWARTFDNVDINLDDPNQRRFGDYELLERIGEGGMGLVYRARQTSLDREVAIKLLAAGPWASSDFIERFTREAQHAARMEHPNIVTVYDVGTVEQLHFFSMRLVRGETLALRLQRVGLFDPREAAALMRTVAEAVAYAHSLDVLHLDLKPGNILLDHDGIPHISDFGLARRLNRMLAVENIEVAGTPNYMAPEQTRSRQGHLSAATDIWSLGAICHELVCGHPPFRADSTQATFDLVRGGTVGLLRRLRPQCPRDLEAIILKCLSKQPDERYQTARALADDLGRFLDHRQVRARPLHAWQRLPRWARREPKLAVTLALALLALLLSLAATTQQWRRADSNAQRAALNAATARGLLWDMREQTALHYAEAGQGWLASPLLLANLREQQAHDDPVRAEDARKRLGILENSNPGLIDISAQPNTSALAFSPHGERLALAGADGQLRLLDTRSGALLWQVALAAIPPERDHAAADHRGLSALRFSADGERLIARVDTTTTALPAADEQMLRASDGHRIDPPSDFADLRVATYSDNGRFAVLIDRSGAVQTWVTQPWRALSARGRLQPDLPAAALPLLLSDNGDFFAAALPSGSLAIYDARTLAPRVRPALGEFGPIAAWALSPDQRRLAVGDGEGRVRVVDCVSAAVRALSPQSSHGVRGLSFSDDGNWLAAATGSAGVYLWNWSQDRLLAFPFGGDPAVDRVSVDRQRARVLSLSEGPGGSGTLWAVEPTPFDLDRTAAVQLGERFSLSTRGHAAAFAWNPPSGLLASVRSSEERGASRGASLLRLERLPQSALKAAHGAALKPDPLVFDGYHLVAAEAHQVQLLDAGDESATGVSIGLNQAAGFAELAASGDLLGVSTGRVVHVYNARSGVEQVAVALPNSPQRVLMRPDGRAVLTTWLEHGSGGPIEVVESWSPANGERLAGPVRLAGPLDGLRYSADGLRLLAWDRQRVSVFDGDTLAAAPGTPLLAARFRDPAHQAAWATAAFGDAGAVLAVLRNSRSDGHEQDRLLRYQHGQLTRVQWLRAGVVEVLPLPHSERLLSVTASGGVDLLDAKGDRDPLPDYPGIVSARGLAASPDGLWIARALRDGVEIYASHDGSRVARLRAPLPLPDQIWQLAFSPDGSRLLGRSLRNRYLVWNLQPDRRPVDALERALALRGIAGLQVPAIAGVGSAERSALRASDPAPSGGSEPSSTGSEGEVPARDPLTPQTALDLDPWHNVALNDSDRSARYTAGDFDWIPRGRQRLLGVDYDVRGFIQLRDASAAALETPPIPQQVRIELPAARALAAVNALALAQIRLPAGQASAAIELIYRNGEHARLPIVAGRHIQEYWREDIGSRAHLAAYGWDARAWQVHALPAHVYAIHVVNPHPDWPVTALRLLALPGKGGAPCFLALTLEPLPAQPSGGFASAGAAGFKRGEATVPLRQSARAPPARAGPAA